MNKEELHKLIEEKQPNICQIVAYKDNERVSIGPGHFDTYFEIIVKQKLFTNSHNYGKIYKVK